MTSPALASLLAHHRHQAVHWPVVARMTPGILLGTALAVLPERVERDVVGAWDVRRGDGHDHFLDGHAHSSLQDARLTLLRGAGSEAH